MTAVGISCIVIGVVIGTMATILAIVLFGKGNMQEQNEDAKMKLQTIGFGDWSKVALWLIVILLGLNVCQMFSMRNQTENLHKDIHKIMGVDASALINCRDRMNPRMWYPTER